MPEKSWMFPYKESFNASMVTKLPWARLGYDMFIFHRLKLILNYFLATFTFPSCSSVWSYSELKKIIPNAIHVTLLRNPVTCYESNYVYMGLERVFK